MTVALLSFAHDCTVPVDELQAESVWLPRCSVDSHGKPAVSLHITDGLTADSFMGASPTGISEV